MTRRIAGLAAFAAAAACAAITPSVAAADEFDLTPIARVPFPERGYVLSVPQAIRLDASDIELRENGVPVRKVRITPVSESGLRFGVVLAIDASLTMKGEPFAAALRAARSFLEHRDPNELVGLVAFNGEVTVLQGATRDEAALERALRSAPEIAYGTRIYDAVSRSIDVLRAAHVAAGSVVLLADGQNVGSMRDLESAVAAARRHHVRVFTVGLRSRAYDDAALRSIAERTDASYVEARSTAELEPLYAELGGRLASEYLVRYRSAARPESRVDVSVAVRDARVATTKYVVPRPAALPPYHRSALSRFVLSPASLFALALVFAVFVAFTLVVLLRGPKRTLVERIGRYASGSRLRQSEHDWISAGKALARSRYTGGWWARLERDLEIARIDMTPRGITMLALVGTIVLFVPLLLVSPAVALLSFASPLAARAFVRYRLRRIRDEFANQFPPSLQVLASALRAGHSFSGALGVVVENAHEPARSELRRVLQDDQLGVMPEEAIRRMAVRMASRDVEQVALLAELQRTAGGNSAEVLDTVVETLRERGELRRLVRTLTAQGRMARWILTALPVVVAGFLFLLQPDIMVTFFSSGGGQAALVLAVVMVVTGSLLIQKIIDIDV
jgi:tight adherence protein B